MKTATTHTETKLCRVAWCGGDHLPATTDYQEHRSTGERRADGLYASVSWLEPRTEIARAIDSGPRVYFAVDGADLSLTPRQTASLATVVEKLAQKPELLREAAALLREMAEHVMNGGAGGLRPRLVGGD